MSTLVHKYRTDSEFLLFSAILEADLGRLSSLIQEGHDPTVVLHSPPQCDGATVIGTAAHQGHKIIVQYLIEKVQIPVDFEDPCLGRTPLFWACMEGHVDVIEYLLEHGANINHRDKCAATPVIQASKSRKTEAVKMLIEKGCLLNVLDKHMASPLHYAAFYGGTDLLDILIRNGCTMNNKSVLEQKTPLASLVLHNDQINCLLLLNSGYSLENDGDMIQGCMSQDTHLHSPVKNLVVQRWKNPVSLQNICRIVIRRSLSRTELLKYVDVEEAIPTPIKCFLLLQC